MIITRTAMTVLLVACGVAGAAGSYWATHPDVARAAPSASGAEAASPSGVVTPPSPAALQQAPQPPAARDTTLGLSAPPARSPFSSTVDSEPATDPSASAEPAASAPASPSSTVSAAEEVSRAGEPALSQSSAPEVEELIVGSDAVVGLQMDSSITSEDARIEDRIVAHVIREVRVLDRIAIPSGTKAYGEVTLVERGGRLRERARLGIRFSSLLFADGSRVPISTEVIFREGDSPSRDSAATIGSGAIGGAIIGGLLGGSKGAVLGGTAGAGAGTAVRMASGRNAASLSAGTPITVRLSRALTVTVDR